MSILNHADHNFLIS